MKLRWTPARPKWLGACLYGVVRGLGSTLRYEIRNVPDDHAKKIYCGWHGRSLGFANYFRRRGWYVIISFSDDGDVQTGIFKRLGYKIIRGSSSRGGVRALAEAISALRGGGTLALTPDGPRGPSGVVQGGIMVMARKSGAALVPVGLSSRPRLVANSWDRYIVPAPFAKCLMIFGDPLYVPPKASDEELEQLRLQLQQEIHRLEKLADAELGLSPA